MLSFEHKCVIFISANPIFFEWMSNIVILNVKKPPIKATFDTGMGFSFTNLGLAYTGSIDVESVSGGAGGYQYKFEAFRYNGAYSPDVVQDFSYDTNFGISSTGNLNSAIYQVTIVDTEGNIVQYRVSTSGTVLSYEELN